MILRARGNRPGAGRLSRPGYVLVAVLIVIVVLSLAAYRFTDAMSSEHRAGVRASDIAQARAAAVSGIHYAAAVLSDRDTFINQLNGNPFDNPAAFSEIVVRTDPNNPNKEARFSIVCATMVDTGVYEQRNGVIDEGGKLNINSMILNDKTGQVLFNALMKLPGMTEDVADAIVDWVDTDDNPGQVGMTGGAENSYYEPLGYRCKNGPLNSLEELLLVKGVTPQLLFGTDQNRNGRPDEPGASGLDRGWSDYLTVHGRELNVDSTGVLRIYVNGDSLKDIYAALVPAVGQEMAAYIAAVKMWGPTQLDAEGNPVQQTGKGGKGAGKGGKGASGGGGTQQKVIVGSIDQLISAVEDALPNVSTSGGVINSVMDLRNTRVTLPRVAGADASTPRTVVNSPLNDPNRLTELLPPLMDKVATKTQVDMIPRINVNTAPREVLLGLPGLDEADVDALLGARGGLNPSDPATVSGAWMLSSAGLTPAKYRRIERYATGSTMVYRVQSVGYLAGGGPVARVEAIIDTNQGNPRILYFRDLADLDNPRGFQPPTRK